MTEAQYLEVEVSASKQCRQFGAAATAHIYHSYPARSGHNRSSLCPKIYAALRAAGCSMEAISQRYKVT